jgi:hypothetical protein
MVVTNLQILQECLDVELGDEYIDSLQKNSKKKDVSMYDFKRQFSFQINKSFTVIRLKLSSKEE